MSKKFIILLLFAGFFVSGHKSFAGDVKRCYQVEGVCNKLIKELNLQNRRALGSETTKNVFCLPFKANPSIARHELAQKNSDAPEPMPAVDKCQELLRNENVSLQKVCTDSVAVMRASGHCD